MKITVDGIQKMFEERLNELEAKIEETESLLWDLKNAPEYTFMPENKRRIAIRNAKANIVNYCNRKMELNKMYEDIKFAER